MTFNPESPHLVVGLHTNLTPPYTAHAVAGDY